MRFLHTNVRRQATSTEKKINLMESQFLLKRCNLSIFTSCSFRKIENSPLFLGNQKSANLTTFEKRSPAFQRTRTESEIKDRVGSRYRWNLSLAVVIVSFFRCFLKVWTLLSFFNLLTRVNIDRIRFFPKTKICQTLHCTQKLNDRLHHTAV